MFLSHRDDGSLLQVVNIEQLFDPFSSTVNARLHAGEELQDQTAFLKAELNFPSGESLPRCWCDPAYRSTIAPA